MSVLLLITNVSILQLLKKKKWCQRINSVGHINRKHVRAEQKWFSRENIWTTFPLNNSCKNRPTLSLRKRKKIKKRFSRQNIWTTFPLNINWGICLSKNKKKKKKKLSICLKNENSSFFDNYVHLQSNLLRVKDNNYKLIPSFLPIDRTVTYLLIANCVCIYLIK